MIFLGEWVRVSGALARLRGQERAALYNYASHLAARYATKGMRLVGVHQDRRGRNIWITVERPTTIPTISKRSAQA
jgi:hypothetical protein